MAAQDREAKLSEIRREITQLEARYQAASRERQSLAASLQQTELQRQLQDRRVREAGAAVAITQSRVRETEVAVARLEERLAARRDELRSHLVTLYGFGRQSYLRLLLSIDADSDLPAAIRQLRFLARHNAAAVDSFEAARAALAAEQEELADQQQEVASWLDEQDKRRRELRVAEREYQRLLNEASRRQRTLRARSDELRGREVRLARLIDLLLEEDDSAFSGSDIQDFRGVLDWPIEGRVVAEFGPRLNSRYRTKVPHKGIAVLPQGGSAGVRAVFPGKVLYAAPFEGYGKTVVISHSGGVFSLYAGLDEVSVSKGDMVSLPLLLGTASGELYFEMRENNEAVDPREWLR